MPQLTSTRNCPQCGQPRLHRSQRRTRLEKTVSLAGATFRRCHACNTRVLQLAGCTFPVLTLERLSRHVSLLLLVALATLFVVALIVWFGRLHAAPSQSGFLDISPRILAFASTT